MTPVCRRVRPVARESAGEHPRHRFSAEAVRDEVMRAVGHRDGDPRSLAGALALEQRGQDLDDGSERAGREVGHLDGRPLGRGVFEHPRPAEVVEVVAGAGCVRAGPSEARDRAVDGRARHVLGADAEACGDAGSEALQHDVGTIRERACEARLVLEIADDGLDAAA